MVAANGNEGVIERISTETEETQRTWVPLYVERAICDLIPEDAQKGHGREIARVAWAWADGHPDAKNDLDHWKLEAIRQRVELIALKAELLHEGKGEFLAPGTRKVSNTIQYFQNVLDRFGDSCVYIRQGGCGWGAVALNREHADRIAGSDSPETLLRTALREHAEYRERVGPIVLKHLEEKKRADDADVRVGVLEKAIEKHLSDGHHFGPSSAELRVVLENGRSATGSPAEGAVQ